MKIDIWSDIRCPFCYIGKRKLELALQDFPERDSVEVIWHSFQLDPGLKTEHGVGVYEYLAARKGISRKQSEDMHHRVSEMARDAGLEFNFHKVVVANSFDGHRLIQMAKAAGKAGDAEERLFRAHFAEGRDISDRQVLAELGLAIGLPERDVSDMLGTEAFADEVRKDESTARYLGINAVPFFIFDNRLAVSGAQSPAVFLQTLERTWEEAKRENSKIDR
jgi:protein disulfide-isomerase